MGWVKRLFVWFGLASLTLAVLGFGVLFGVVKWSDHKIRKASPVTAYILNQDVKEKVDLVPKFLEEKMTRENVFEFLDVNDFNFRSATKYPQEPDLSDSNFYFYKGVTWGIAHSNATIFLTFDENNKLLSAHGYNEGGYW